MSSTVTCQACGWSSVWPTPDIAGCAATWHVWEAHRGVWVELYGNLPPRDPRPEALLVRSSNGQHIL